MNRALAIALAVAACGGRPETAAEKQTAVYEAKTEGRIEVARVNGEPVFGDCVAMQAEATGVSAEVARQQCIEFELLAQAARDRGYLSHRSVVRTSRIESVRALIEQGYPMTSADKISAGDVRHFWNSRGLKQRYNHPEARKMVFCVALEKPDATAEQKAMAQAAVDAVLAELKQSATQDAAALVAACDRQTKAYAGKIAVQFGRHGAYKRGFDEAIGDALFALPAANAYVDRPIRNPTGLLVVMLEAILPPETTSFEDATPEIQKALFRNAEAAWWRYGKFVDWYKQFERGHSIERFDERIPTGGL